MEADSSKDISDIPLKDYFCLLFEYLSIEYLFFRNSLHPNITFNSMDILF